MRRPSRTNRLAPDLARLHLEGLERRDVPATYAQGDIVFLGVGSTDPDSFRIVNLKPMDAGDAISFTDNGFLTGTTGRTNEGYLTYTVPAGGHPAGTVLTWTNGMVITGTGWGSSAPATFLFSGAGDQLFMFTGPAVNANWSSQSGITLIAGVNFGTALSSTSSSNNTVQPTALTTAFLNLPSSASTNVYYSGTTSATTSVFVGGTPASILTDLNTPTKWYSLVPSGVVTYPAATTLVVTASPTNQSIAAGGNTTFSAAASGNAAPSVLWEESTNGGSSYAPLSNAGVYSGVTTPTLTITGATAGMTGYKYRAVFTNTGGSATTAAATLTVTAPVTVTVNPASLPDPVLLTPYSQPLSASGGTAPYTFDVSAGTLPTGLALDLNTGALSGTPTASGTFTFTVRATDAGSNSGTRAYTLVVPLVVGPATLPNGTRGVAYSQTITATGGTAPYTFAVTAGALPSGLGLDTNTGVISGTPDTANSFNFTVTVTNGTGRSGSRAYSVVVAPSASVASVVRVGGPNTNAASVSWMVTFSQAVSGLTPANFTLTDVTNSLTGEGIASVTAVGGAPATQWTVSADTGTGEGTLRLDVTSATGATPTLIGLPTSITTADFTIDRTAPTVAIGTPSASLTTVGPVTFSVTYTGADTITLAPGNVTLNATGGVTATVSVSPTGNPRTVTLSGITGTGTLGISLAANTASDLAGNTALAAGPSATFQVDNSPPVVSSVVRVGSATVTNAAQVQYTVTFNEPVVLGATPFTVTPTGTLTGVSVTGVGGGPTAYTVTVDTGSGDGTIRLDVPAGPGVKDLANNPLATAFSTGELFVIDRTAPVVAIGPPSAPLTAGGPVSFLVTYTDANLSPFTLTPGQITLNRTGTADATVGVSGSGNTWTVTLTGVSGNGTLGISLPAGTAADAAGNLAAAAGPSATVAVDNATPAVQSVVRVGGAVTNASAVQFSVTFSEDVSGVTTARFTPVGASLSGLAVTNVTGGPRVYLVDVSTGSGDGQLRLDVPASAAVTDAAGNPLAAAFTTGELFTIDRTSPTVTIGPPSAALTRGGPVSFTVTYADANGVTPSLAAGQITLNATGGATATVGVSGSGNTRTVTLTGIAGNGTLGISLPAGTAADAAGNLAAAAGPSATVAVDNATPAVQSVVRVGGAVTNASAVQFSVTFSEDVSGVTTARFTPVGASLTGLAVTNVTGGPRVYLVDVSTGSGDGPLRLDVPASAAVTDAAGNPLATPFTTGEVFTLDRTAPAVAIGPPSAPLTAGGPVSFLVTYTDANLSPFTLTPGQITLNRTGTADATVGVSGSGNTWTITLTGIAGNGTLGISLPAGTAADAAGNLAVAAGPSAAVAVDNATPAVQSVVRVGGAVTNASAVQFSVTFSEDVSGVTTARFTPVGASLAGLAVTNVTGGPRVYLVDVSTGSGDGQLRLDVPASAAVTDAAGNPLAAAFTTGELFTIDRTPPTVTIGPPSAALTRGGPVSFTVTYADANGVTPSLAAGHITLNATGGATATVEVSGSGNTRTVTLTGIAGNGTLGISIAAATALDGATNAAPSAGPSTTFDVDNTAPLVTTVVRAAGNPTNAASAVYTVSFNEDVAPPAVGAFTLTTTGTLSGTSVSSATVVNARTYTVAVATGSGDGTLRLNVPAGAAITDIAGNPLALSFTSGEAYTVLKTAPAVATTSPTNGTVIGPIGYGGTISGTAADALGGSVSSVSVMIQRSSDGSYWTGSAWAVSGSLAATVTGTTWSVPFPAAAQATGLTYTTTSAAADAAGNARTAAAVAYQWDASPAAATVALGGTVFGPGTWAGTVGGAATDTGPAGLAVVNVVITRSSDGFRYNAGTQSWAAGAFTNAVVPAAGAWSLSLPSGQLAHGVNYTVNAAAEDGVGNVQTTPASASFSYDTVAPTSAVTAPTPTFVGPTGWPASNQLAGTVSDSGAGGVATVRLGVTRSSDGFYWAGAAWQSAAAAVDAAVAAGSWTYTLAAAALADGLTYTVTSTATDGAGNVQLTPGNRSFTWDVSAPGQTITAPVGGSFAGPTAFPGFAGTTSDPGAAASGVAAVDLTLTRNSDGFFWNGTAFVSGPTTFPAGLTGGTWTYSFNPAALADGVTYTLSAAARDVVGNVGAPAAASFTFDAAGPSATVTAPAAASTATASTWADLAGTAGDGGAGVQLVEYRVLTAAGQVWNGGTFATTGNWFSASATTNWTAAFPFTNFPAGGGYRVEARATDAVGNVGPVAAIDFTVAVPTVVGIAVHSPASSATNTTTPVTWRVTFSDPVSGVTAANFALVGSFGAGSAITGVTPAGGSAWDVTATVPAAGTGTLGLNYVSNVNISPVAATATVVGAVYTLDRVAPTVAITNDAPGAVIRVNQPVRYTVTFGDDTAVGSAGLTAGDVTNAIGTGAAPFVVSGFTPTGPSGYAFDVTLTGEGDFRLRLAAPAVADTAGNTLADPVTDATTLTADGTVPTVASVVPLGTSPTQAATVSYSVTFSEAVSGIDASDFTLFTTGAVVPGAISVNAASGTTFTVSVGTGSGDGTIRLDVLANGSVRDVAGNPLAAGFTTAAAFAIDRTAPTVAVTLAAGQPTLTNTEPIRFEVKFSEPVSGFGPTVVQLGGTAGGLGSASKQVTNPSGDDRTYLVAVSGLITDGTLTISVSPGAASDAAGNALAVGAASPAVTLDRTAPFVNSITRGSASPTNAATVSYTVNFSEAVDGVGTSDFALLTAGLSGASIVSVGGGGAVWTVVVGTGSGDGTLRLDLRPTVTAADAAGNPLLAGAVSGGVYDIDHTAPTATVVAPTPALRNTPVGSVAVTFDQAVTGLDAADFTLTRDGLPLDLSAAQLTGGGTAYTLGNLFALTAAGGDYVLKLKAGGSGVIDAAGNPLAADANTSFTVDVAAPTVTITPNTTAPTNAATVAFTVAFVEPVGGVDTNPAGGFDFFAVTGTAPGAAIVSVVPGVPGVYTVTVGTGSGAGTIALSFGANTVVTDAAGNAVSGLPAASTFTAIDHVSPTVTITEGDADGVVAVNAVVTFTVDVLDNSDVGGTLSASDFENAGTAGISVGSVTFTAIAGGLRFDVPVTPTTGGTLLLRLKAGAGVADGAGNDPDLPVVAGRTLIVDAAAPTVTVSRPPGQAAVTNTQPVQFAVDFSEPVVGFVSGRVRLAGPGTAGAGIAVSGDGQFFVVTVSGLTADGPVTLTVPAGAVADTAGNPNAASAGGDNTVTLDTAPPAVGLPVLAPASDTGAAAGLTSDATPTFTGTAEPGATVELFEGTTRLGTATAGGPGWTITSSTLADGTHVLFARVTDAAGNAADSGSIVVRIDTGRPTVSVTRGPGQPDAVPGDDGGVSVTFTVTTSESVGSLNPGAISVVGSAGGSVTAVTGSGTTFLVTIGGISNSGSVSLAVADGAGTDAAGNPTAAAPAGESVVVTFPTLPPLPTGQNSTGIYATVAGTSVTVFNADGSVRGTVAPFTRDESPFEVRVAVADVTGDGVPDVIAGTAAGAPAMVRVLDGATGTTVYSLGVFEGFRGGVFVAAGDLNGDGKSEVVVTPDQNGGPRVLVFDGATGGQFASFLGIQDDNFRGGARVAVGDINGDGTPDLVVSAGFGGGPRVAGFDGTTVGVGKQPKKLFNDFFLFAPDLRDGVYVTVGDVDGDGYGDVIGGAGPGGAPRVLILSGYDLVTTGSFTPLASFFSGPSTLRGGVRVVAKDFDGDSMADLVTGSGDSSAVFVYGNAALNAANPRPDDKIDMLPGLLPGVHVG